MKKILITESQFKTLVENIVQFKHILNEELSGNEYLKVKWEIEDDFIKMLDNLEKKTHEQFKNDIFWVDKDNNVIIRYNDHNKEINMDFHDWWKPTVLDRYPTIGAAKLHSMVKTIIQENLMWVKDFNEYYHMGHMSNYFTKKGFGRRG